MANQNLGEESFLTIVAPGDIIGAITAGFNAITAIAQAAKAVAQDQSAEGRATARAMLEVTAPVTALFRKLNQKLKIDPLLDDVDHPAPAPVTSPEPTAKDGK